MTTTNFTTSKLLKKSSQGFTLIELLIVIAVIGVLAAVVLAAINPAEQLRRGRDSSRLQEVASLGHATAAYYTSQGKILTLPLPANAGTWQNGLVSSGDINAALVQPSGGGVVTNCAPPAASGDNQNNFCYIPNGANNFYITTAIESNLYATKANNGVVCGGATFPFFVYDSNVGRAGETCMAANATTPGPIYY